MNEIGGRQLIVAGDIGGTKTHLVLCRDGEDRAFVKEKKFASREYETIEEILREFLGSVDEKIEKICFGIAGPVRDNRCQATNLPWVVDAEKLTRDFGVEKGWLINDLEANAYGIFCLKDEDFATLQQGTPGKGNRALIAAGTGLGEAGIFLNGEEYIPFACEGGHSSFGPIDEEDLDLWRYLKGKYGHVSYERILSGPGLRNLYNFYIDTKKEKLKPNVEERMRSEDKAKVITEFALNHECPACERSLERFVMHYGSEAGNLALKMLTFGGMFLGGGIAPKILPALQRGAFVRYFSEKGRFAELLSSIEVRVILNENAALLGAIYYAQTH